jgi:FkbM family methyltransferase
MKILAHTSFIGNTGYANHARSFFTALNKYHTVKVRNLTIGDGWKGYGRYSHDDEPYITDEMKDMLYEQTLFNQDGSRSDYPLYNFDGNFTPDVHIILAETNNYYFYENYDGYKIAYNVWESTRYPEDFFERLKYFDEVWVPTQWQFDSLVEQGYPKNKITIVPEGVDIETFKPLSRVPLNEKFRFLLFGRWDYRKSTTEIIKTFGETFKGNDNVELICSVENPYPSDGMETTSERINVHKLFYDNVRYVKFPSRKEYVQYLQGGNVFISCARSEGWNLPLIESMSCGTPSIYSNWGGQLQFAAGKGLPVNIAHMRQANIGDKDVLGEYCEPDFEHLAQQMLNAYNSYNEYKTLALEESKKIHEDFNWDKIANDASNHLNRFNKSFAFVTTGNLQYMPVIEKLVQSLLEFSNQKIIVYGVDCDVPFDYPNVIKRKISPPKISEHDKWYWKQHACMESLNEGFDYYIWVDGDVVVNYNIDTVTKYFNGVGRYPLSDIHVQEEFFGTYDDGKTQLFNEELAKRWETEKRQPYMHICFYIYNEGSKSFFYQILLEYKTLMETEPKNYKKLFLWNDEGIDNALRWSLGYTNHLPLSNFDTSSYDGDDGNTNQTLHHFYKFWNEEGPQNFNRIFGYQAIPEDKSNIIYFHGNKNADISDKMIEFIKMKRDNSFHQSEYFYTDIYTLENLGDIKNVQGGTIDIANQYGWARAIYHEIYNLLDYYNNRQKTINEGDVVVDLGGNIGIFNRWAYSQGASKVISFEPDSRYFKLLSLNSDSRSVLFNAAISYEKGHTTLYESNHLGGSNIYGTSVGNKEYTVKTYTLDYLFQTKLIDKIDFLKVDIEGAEHYAFGGISDENLMKVKTIAMEYHHSHYEYNEEMRNNLIKRLNNLGFNSYLMFMGTNNALQMIYFTR